MPRRVAVCPYCHASLEFQATSWDEGGDGRWRVDSGDTTCTAEPDIDSDEWNDWWEHHRQMPYVYQLPVDERVREWARRSAARHTPLNVHDS